MTLTEDKVCYQSVHMHNGDCNVYNGKTTFGREEEEEEGGERERETRKIMGKKKSRDRERQKEVLCKSYPTKFPVQMYLVPVAVIL